MDTNILERVEGRRGVLDVTRPRVDVLRFKVDGYLELGMAQAVVRWVEQVLSTEPTVITFSDWNAVSDYEPSARALLTHFMKEHLPRVGNAFILVRWRGVQMGVTLANAILGGPLKVYVDREAFDAAYQDVLAGTQVAHPDGAGDYWPRPPAAG
jgi:hypothetical protein